MGFFGLCKRERKTANLRREMLVRQGRLTDGTILEIVSDGDTTDQVRYEYRVHGVGFESYETLTDEQRKDPLKYAPGATVGVRYDPGNHGNSIIV